ncbi:hypothetical protein KI387_030527, partial [Taxus chinensis]
PPKGKHIVENVPAPNPTTTIEVDEEEEECEDSGVLEHRGWRQPTERVETEHTDAPPQVQEADEDLDVDVVPEEHRFKR